MNTTNQQQKKLINHKQFLRLKKNYDDSKIKNPEKYLSINMKKKIKIEKNIAFKKIEEFIFSNIDVKEIFVGLIIIKNNNKAFINEYQKNEKVSYVVKFGAQYVEFSFEIIEHNEQDNEIKVIKNFIHSKKISWWSKLLVKNQAKSEMESIFKFINKKEKKKSFK